MRCFILAVVLCAASIVSAENYTCEVRIAKNPFLLAGLPQSNGGFDLMVVMQKQYGNGDWWTVASYNLNINPMETPQGAAYAHGFAYFSTPYHVWKRRFVICDPSSYFAMSVPNVWDRKGLIDNIISAQGDYWAQYTGGNWADSGPGKIQVGPVKIGQYTTEDILLNWWDVE